MLLATRKRCESHPRTLWVLFVLALGAACQGSEPTAKPGARAYLDGAGVSSPTSSQVEYSPALDAAYLRARQAEAGAEYALVPTAGLGAGKTGARTFTARNPTQGFRVRFEGVGVTVEPWSGQAWRLGLRWRGFGAGDGPRREVCAAEPEASANRAEYRRGSGPGQRVAEWYVNGPAGLEQGFTVAEPPSGSAGEGLVLELALSGDLAPRLWQDGGAEAVTFHDASGVQLLSYGGLHVEDAVGRELPATLALVGGNVELRVEDRGAAYPVTIDPWIQTSKLTASPPTVHSDFGHSVSISGNTAAIGLEAGNSKVGAAYMFTRNGIYWTQLAKLTANDATLGDFFGYSTSVSADTAIFGAWGKGPNWHTGAAYVFVRNGTNWIQQAKITASDSASQDQFGYSVMVSGNMAVIGANTKSSATKVFAGAAYIFMRNGTKWNQQAKLTAGDAAYADEFGSSVLISGDTAIIGALKKNLYTGAAYVFVRSGTNWAQQAKLTASDGVPSDRFGISVSGSGDTALIGADGTKSGGAVYVFTRNGKIWNQQAKLTAGDSISGGSFGISVSLSGDTALIGAYTKNGKGAAYTFTRSGTNWAQQAKLTASDGANSDCFGYSVSVSGNTALVGAEQNSNTGAAYIFKFDPAQLGVTCTSGKDCLSGYCADGVCCDTACGGGSTTDCQTCAKTLGASADGTCTMLSSATVCRTASGDCDVAENCSGTSASCPIDEVKTSGTVCHTAVGVCDVSENCDGTTKTCPQDAFASSSTVCRVLSGDCDAAETCTGTSALCPPDTVKSSGTVCRAAAGVCDQAEFCDGSTKTCPQDAIASSSTVCRAKSGDCDVAETCTGSSVYCPVDSVANISVVCRSSAGICDVSENCDGTTKTCPKNAFASVSTVCRAKNGDCDVAETCTGNAAACPNDSVAIPGTICRAAAGDCDTAETCNGATKTCPTDAVLTSGTVCRAKAGDCDVAEICDGKAKTCPADVLLISGIVCRPKNGDCDVAEICTGTSVSCPADSVAGTSTVCRASAGVCDLPDSCDGASKICPSDSLAPSSTVCRQKTGDCDVAETCTGTSAGCPGDSVAGTSTVCRASTGVCDVVESCDGAAKTCPADAFASSSTVCRAKNGDCDVAETCTGTSTGCPGDSVAATSIVCRASTGVCDIAESCDGATKTCPADAFVSSSTVCRAKNGDCDIPETCTGSSASCPTNSYQASGTPCDDSVACTKSDVCDGKGSCAGTSYVCIAAECEASSICDGKGGCTITNQTDGIACSKGTCQGGVCVAPDAGPTPDAAPDSQMGKEAGFPDAGFKETGQKDAGLKETGSPDVAHQEGGQKDVGSKDAGKFDKASPDISTGPDAGSVASSDEGCSCSLESEGTSSAAWLILVFAAVFSRRRNVQSWWRS